MLVAKIVRGGQNGALDHLDTSQGSFRSQLAALTDAVRQVIGNPEIGPGAVFNDPLNAPYVLYVDPFRGKDTFVGGSYSTGGAAAKRIELQRLECGYTQARPFKTVNRAAIEVGILTAKGYYTSPLATSDLVTIVLMPGAFDPLNGNGYASVTEWPSGKEPTNAELQSFNTFATGGIVLPRGVSVVALFSDLRKTILRPSYVPPAADELANCGNRRTIFKVTGTGYYWGLTFMDKVGHTESHHLLHCFEFASKGELDEFYGKIRQAFGGPSNTGGIDATYADSRQFEYEIVGPRPPSGSQTIDTDTVRSASPYPFNCSVRSQLGLCGVFADGAKPTGFKSMVIAQFTGVSQQQDMTCWERYDNGNWVPVNNYAQYITTEPDNIRMKPERRSFHIRALNNAIIQEVSVFAIGQGIQHWAQSGGEITATNGNSNFGGCAGLAEGYKSEATISDRDWNVASIRVATDLTEKRGNVRKLYLGQLHESVTNNSTSLQLTQDLSDSASNPGIPSLLDREGYSLRPGSYLWIENPRGQDYRAQLAASPWSATAGDVLQVTTTLQAPNGIRPGDLIINAQGYETGQTWPDLAGARVYIRRLQDTRSVDERKYSLRCNSSSAAARTPVRDYVLQTTPGSGGAVSLIPDDAVVTVANAAPVTSTTSGVLRSVSVELRRNNPVMQWTSRALYRPGDCVTRDGKKWSCLTKNSDQTFTPDKWSQIYVHMESTYNPEDYWKNAQSVLVFDNDTDGADNTETCGYDLSTVWASDQLIRVQYQSSSDYRGLHSLLVSLGFSAANAHTILLPTSAATRERNPSTALDNIAAPAGSADSWSNWPVEFRRPSIVNLRSHTWDWAGTLNYTKALPEYQRSISPLNKFSYYFTSKDGGRAYGGGWNEESYLVGPQGLQDATTGTQISFEQIGEPNVDIDAIEFPTSYESLTANTLSIGSELNINGVVKGSPVWEGGYGEVLPPLPQTSNTAPGLIELATADEVKEFLRDDLAVTPATLIQALGDAIKNVVNLRVSLSSSNSVPSANQLNSTNIFIHPYSGNEIALYSTASLRWQVVRFSGVRTFGLAPCNLANTNYDIYLYNSGTTLNSTLAVEFTPWVNDTTPPARGVQDGVIVRNNNPARRLIGVVRTTTAGASTIDLGGVIMGANSDSYPRVYLANLYNLYDFSARYFFGNSWTTAANGWSPAPASVYPVAPRVSWVQATDSLVTAFLDLYSNYSGENFPSSFSGCYVAPGIDTTAGPPEDAFYGETIGMNDTVGSQWARALGAGKRDIYYLYKLVYAGTVAVNYVNEHPAHGLIVTGKV